MFQQAMQVMSDLFARDCQFAMATARDNRPSVRYVDTFYEDGSFFVVTYANSQKVQELNVNSHVALCNGFYRFRGRAYNLGHPLQPENQEIRSKLIKVFEPWYFAHNDENDEHMCYVEIKLTDGFFYKDGTGYQVDFEQETAEAFPFERDF
jgi:hypothetical protein